MFLCKKITFFFISSGGNPNNLINGNDDASFTCSLKETGSNGENAWFAIDFGPEKPCKIFQIQFGIYDSDKGGYLKVN